MTNYSTRKRSFREIRRFHAIDQYGVQHTVIERVAVLNDVGASGCIFNSENGKSQYYSATSGDAVVQLSDGSLKTKDGKLAFDMKLQLKCA
jgi:hypothetical protein